MGVTNYMTVNGKIRSEQRSGEAHSRDYVLDRLGSVIQIYQNGWPIADACYEPYGGIYTQWNMEGKTFTWLGGWGYRQTGVEWSSVYVRARHYSRGMSNWTSIDPLWPSEMAYGYVEGRVMTRVDPSGMQVTLPLDVPILCNFFNALWNFAGGKPNSKLVDEINDCIKSNRGSINCPLLTDLGVSAGGGKFSYLACLVSACRDRRFSVVYNDPKYCCPNSSGSLPAANSGPGKSNCQITLCTENWALPNARSNDYGGDREIPAAIFNSIHEALHCCQVDHGTNDSLAECNDIIACCIYNVVMKKSNPTRRCRRK